TATRAPARVQRRPGSERRPLLLRSPSGGPPAGRHAPARAQLSGRPAGRTGSTHRLGRPGSAPRGARRHARRPGPPARRPPDGRSRPAMSDGAALPPPAKTGSRLPELIALAQEDSSPKRRALLRELTDCFFGAPQRTEAETALYGAVLSELTDAMETAVRAELAERFAEAPDAPHQLIRRLANDEAETVAAPVLSASPVLTEADLIGVVRSRGQGHMRAVSRRAAVSEAVSDAIVERGDDETLGVLLGNDGASLSRAASETAVDRARANPALHAVTVERSSLPPDLLNDLYFEVEARLRQRILEQNARMDPALLESALAA